MRKVALIYNPASGQNQARRAAQVDVLLMAIRAEGIHAEAVPTRAPGTAGEQAREAVGRGCETVFACGGDGTVHEVLQGMVGSTAAMGVIPLGTANSLACDIGLPRNPVQALRMLLTAEPLRIAAGRMEFCSRNQVQSRYFTVAAGIGPDAHVFYSMNYAAKRRFGNPYYYWEAVHVWVTHKYPLFEVEYTPNGSGIPRRELVSQLLGVRISDFGGLLRHLAPGAALRKDDLRLVLFKTRSRFRYLQYMTAVVLGREPRVPGVEFVDATSVQCRPQTQEGGACGIHAEADGELLGVLPVRLSIVPDAVSLLIPDSPST